MGGATNDGAIHSGNAFIESIERQHRAFQSAIRRQFHLLPQAGIETGLAAGHAHPFQTLDIQNFIVGRRLGRKLVRRIIANPPGLPVFRLEQSHRP